MAIRCRQACTTAVLPYRPPPQARARRPINSAHPNAAARLGTSIPIRPHIKRVRAPTRRRHARHAKARTNARSKHQSHARRDTESTLIQLLRPQRCVRCHQRRRASCVVRDAWTVNVQHIREAARRDRRRRPSRCVHAPPHRRSHQHLRELAPRKAQKDAGQAAAKRRAPRPTGVQGSVPKLEQKPLAWIHRRSLCCRHAEREVVAQRRTTSQERSMPHAACYGICQSCQHTHLPTARGHLTHSIAAASCKTT